VWYLPTGKKMVACALLLLIIGWSLSMMTGGRKSNRGAACTHPAMRIRIVAKIILHLGFAWQFLSRRFLLWPW